jgi:cell division septation protein DedD
MPAATSYTHNAVYVHVANYRTSAEAQTVAQRVKRMGMPVRIGRVERGYDSYRMVIAGPFASPSAAQSALAKAHKAGYRNAKLR